MLVLSWDCKVQVQPKEGNNMKACHLECEKKICPIAFSDQYANNDNERHHLFIATHLFCLKRCQF